MRLLIVFALLALAAAQVTVSPVSFLTRVRKDALHHTNFHHIESMDLRTHKWLKDFINELEAHQTYIELATPILGGHSVTFKFLEGQQNLLASLGAKHRVAVTGNRLEVRFPDVVSAVAVDTATPAGKTTKPYGKPGNPVIQPDLKAVNEKDFKLFGTNTAARAQWYLDNNMAQASKMSRTGRTSVEWLLNQLKSTKTIIQLQPPVRKGHFVRFVVISGSLADVQKFASPCRIKVSADTIEVPHRKGECHVVADADAGTHPAGQVEVNSNEVDPATGWVKPIPNLVPTAKRNVVKVLPEKYIKE